MPTHNEAAIDAAADKALGYPMFSYAADGPASPDAVAALAGDRRALRRLVKDALRNTGTFETGARR